LSASTQDGCECIKELAGTLGFCDGPNDHSAVDNFFVQFCAGFDTSASIASDGSVSDERSSMVVMVPAI
jgi:hypothetical protein